MSSELSREQASRVVRGLARSLVPALGAVALSCLAPSGAATAEEGGAQPTTPVAESWYRPAPACVLPIACPPVAPPPSYPEGTLHVGLAAGQEESRSYIALPLPATGLLGGTLTIPVASSSDGSVQPEAAKIRACLVAGSVKDKVAGEVSPGPSPDCSTSSTASLKTTPAGIVLTVDLAPFVLEWTGASVGAVALVGEVAAQTDAWHVAFSRHDRTGAGVLPLSVSLLVAGGETAIPEDVPSVDVSEPAPVPPLSGEALEAPLGPGALPEPVAQVAPQAPTVAISRPIRRTALAVDTSFMYPGVFLLPPLVMLAVGWGVRAFTRDLAEGSW